MAIPRISSWRCHRCRFSASTAGIAVSHSPSHAMAPHPPRAFAPARLHLLSEFSSVSARTPPPSFFERHGRVRRAGFLIDQHLECAGGHRVKEHAVFLHGPGALGCTHRIGGRQGHCGLMLYVLAYPATTATAGSGLPTSIMTTCASCNCRKWGHTRPCVTSAACFLEVPS